MLTDSSKQIIDPLLTENSKQIILAKEDTYGVEEEIDSNALFSLGGRGRKIY